MDDETTLPRNKKQTERELHRLIAAAIPSSHDAHRHSLIVPDTCRGQRLDQALAGLTPYSRSRLQALLRDGAVRLDGRAVKPSLRLSGGERITIELPPNAPLALHAEAIALDILYEDEELLVVNKPAGMVVHPSCGHHTGTLVHALLHHCPHLPGINGVERPGIVHRLDKDTSGSLVVAKTERAQRGLGELFQRHDLRREYLAWCRGCPSWGEKRIESTIGRHPRHRQKMAVLPDGGRGKLAITEARREACFDGLFSRLRLRLHTGRTHQIRVHLSAERLPILGDALYARAFQPAKHLSPDLRAALAVLSRQALHAEYIGFAHPCHGRWIECHAPLPEDLLRLDAALRTWR